jgi:polyvinyl alcohol dehydrogenase (cytochrome)
MTRIPKCSSVLAMAMVAAAAVVACETAATDPVEASGGWPSMAIDHSNSAHNRVESTISVDNVANLAEAWRSEVGGVTGTPAVVGGSVYFGDWLGVVYSLDAENGSLVWAEEVTDAPISSSVTVTPDKVLVSDLGGGLHAIDRDDGSLDWSTQIETNASLFASPVVVEDRVVISMTDTELEVGRDDFRASIVAVDLEDGSEVWRLYTDSEEVPGHWVSVWSSAAYDPQSGLLYVGTGNTNHLAADEDSMTDLPLADGVLAIDHATGEIVWFYKLIEEDGARDLDVGGAPNLFTIGDQEVIGVGGKSGDYVVLDRETGKRVWIANITSGGAAGGVLSTSAVGDDAIYVASNDGGMMGTLFALESDSGAVVWETKLNGPAIGGSVALANGVVYRGTFSGRIHAVSASDGSHLWADELREPVAGGLSIYDGTVYVGYGSGTPGNMQAPQGGVIAYRVP